MKLPRTMDLEGEGGGGKREFTAILLQSSKLVTSQKDCRTGEILASKK